MLRAIVVVIVGVVGFAPAATAATLGWTAPKACPDVASLRARIERRLERSLDDVDVRVDIEVSRSRGLYIARVDLGAVTVANDVRTLSSRRCGELADAVAVIVARVASEAATAAASRRAAAPVVVAAAEPMRTAASLPAAHEPVDQGLPVAGRAAPRGWTVNARVSALSGIGVIPKVGLGGELAISVRAGNHLAELGAARWTTSASQPHDGAPAPVDVNLDVTLARYGWRPTHLPLRAWVAVEVGSMNGSGVDLGQIAAGRWIAGGSGFGVAWQMTDWVRLVGGTEVLFAFERVRFTGTDGIVVYAPAPMSVRTTVGFELGWQ